MTLLKLESLHYLGSVHKVGWKLFNFCKSSLLLRNVNHQLSLFNKWGWKADHDVLGQGQS